jgi:hypothetical protein
MKHIQIVFEKAEEGKGLRKELLGGKLIKVYLITILVYKEILKSTKLKVPL